MNSIIRPLAIAASLASDALMEGAFSGVTDAIDEFSYYVTPSLMRSYKNFTDVEDNGLREPAVGWRRSPDAQTTQTFHERLGVKIHSFYGASETGGIAYDAGDALMPDGQVGTPMSGATV